LRLELTDLKELGANLELLGFNPMEIADITLGKDLDFKEYDESAADDVEMITCPNAANPFQNRRLPGVPRGLLAGAPEA
jgi:hypothetical protein